MKTGEISDRDAIYGFLSRTPGLQAYAIGDLDDAFFGDTKWYAAEADGRIRAIALLYRAPMMPVLHALAVELKPMAALLRSVSGSLPDTFGAHLSGGLRGVLDAEFRFDSHGAHYKMLLKKPELPEAVDCSEVVELCGDDIADMSRLYEQAYAGNFFEPGLLRTGRYYGIRRDGRLVCAAGVHVYSRRYSVAALGNIVTHPDYRRRGLARAATACLCRELSADCDFIGLNVKADNSSALSLYRGLGFAAVGSYIEYTAVRRD